MKKNRIDADSRIWTKLTYPMTVVMLTSLCVQPSYAASTSAHIFDSAKHTRIYFPAGAEAFADESVEYKVGKKKPPHLWESPDAALGTPNFKDHEGDRLARKPSFAALGGGGSITLRFTDNAIVDFPGPDIYIFEPRENSSPVQVEVSRDGKNWVDLGPDLHTASEIDIAGKGGKHAIFNFIRITDLSEVDPADQWPGADVDAVGALNSVSKISVQNQALCPESSVGKKKVATEGGESKTIDIGADLKKVAALFSSSNANKVVVEVYSDSHSDGKTASTESSTADSKNSNAKKCAESTKQFLVGEGKIPADRLEMLYFDNARSMARREVEKEHERNNRLDFIVVPYDRDTVIGDKGALKVDQAYLLIDGKWDSGQGEVILITQRIPGSKNVQVTGEWHESPAQKGIVQSGTYDPKTQILSFPFVKTWSNVKGNADFKLSYDSIQLKGTWKSESGATGDWLLVRKN